MLRDLLRDLCESLLGTCELNPNYIHLMETDGDLGAVVDMS